jgi:hypothetical protein
MNNEILSFNLIGLSKLPWLSISALPGKVQRTLSLFENVSAGNATRTSYMFIGPALYAFVYTRPLHWCVVEVVGSCDNVLTLN